MMTSPIATTKWKYGCQRFVALLSIIVVVLAAEINPTFAKEATVATKVLNEEGEGSPGDDASYEPGKANGRDGTDRSKEVYALDDSTSSHEMMKDLNWESELDQTRGPFLRKEDNPEEAKNNTYARPEKCTLDVEIKCSIKSNDPEEQEIPAADCIESDIHEVCFEDAEVYFEICASAGDMDEGTRVNLTKSSVGFRGDKEEAPIADFSHDGKIVVGHQSKSCFTYTKHLNQCASPVNSVVKLTGESDGYPAGCRGSAEYATSENIKKMQASKRRKSYKQAMKATKPPQDHSIAVQSEFEGLKCDVNWVSLAAGGIAVAAGAVAAAAGTVTGGVTIAVAVPALTGGIAAIAGSTSCDNYSQPEKQYQNTEDAIRQIIKYENAEQTRQSYAAFLREVEHFQDANGGMDLDQVSEAKLASLYTMGFTVRQSALGSDILSLQVYALTTQVQILAQFALLVREANGSQDCQVTANRLWSLLDVTVKQIDQIYKKFAVEERERNLDAECWCQPRCGGFLWSKTEGKWMAKSKYLDESNQIYIRHGNCGGWDRKSCDGADSRWRCDQPIKQYRDQWDKMVDKWWQGFGLLGFSDYVIGVAKPYHEILNLRDIAKGSANLAKVCGARRSDSKTEEVSTTVNCGGGRSASTCNECPRMYANRWDPTSCGGDCDYVRQTQWRNPGKPDKCLPKAAIRNTCGGGVPGDYTCVRDDYQCCSPYGNCGRGDAWCWKPLTSPTPKFI